MDWKITVPKNDDEYFAKMSRAIFQAGLNWKMIENKWPAFMKSFSSFSVAKVSKFGDKELRKLMKDASIVRNEKKIMATILNAQQFAAIKREYGSFKKYLDSFKTDHERLSKDLSARFKFLGPSTARMFMWMAGVKLKPNAHEKAWHATHMAKK